MNATALRVLCVDDHAFIAEGLKARFALEPDLEFAGWLPSTTDVLSRIAELRVSIVLLDIDLPGPDPFELLGDVARQFPEVRVLILSAHVRDQYIDAAIQAGAWGYLSKSDAPDEVVLAIRRAVRGEFAFGPRVQERCHVAPRNTDGAAKRSSRLDQLTPRELQLLRMIGKGLSRTRIAQLLHRSPKTVDNHRAAIMEKLGIRDRVELVRFAIREGLTEA